MSGEGEKPSVDLHKGPGRVEISPGPLQGSHYLSGTIENVCTLHLGFHFGYMMCKVSALHQGLGEGRVLPRTFVKVYTLHHPSFGAYHGEGPCPLEKFKKGKDLCRGLQWILPSVYMTTHCHP